MDGFRQLWARLLGRQTSSARMRRGQRGEALAERWLIREQGWKSVARNWRSGRGELDLIMRTPAGQLVFVEVRGRAAHAKVGGYHSVTAKKRKILRKTVLAYLHKLRGPTPAWRFDIVEVVWRSDAEPELRHHANAKL